MMRKVAPWFAVLVLGSTFNVSAQSRSILKAEHGLTAPSSASAEAIVRGYVERADRPLALVREQKADGVSHLRFEQIADGRQVYGAYVKATVDAHGRITSIIDETVPSHDVIASALSPSYSSALAYAAARSKRVARPANWRRR